MIVVAVKPLCLKENEMNITYEERQELNELSRRVFGTTSRWKKILDNGSVDQMEREREVMVPQANGSVKKKVFKDQKGVIKRYTVEDVRKLMLDLLAKHNSEGQEALAKISNSKQVISAPSSQFPEGCTVELSDGTTAVVGNASSR